jgi:uncharacterized membrane protein
MTKNEFIQKLEVELKSAPKETRLDIIADYEEHFEAGLSEGKTEAEIAKKLGDPVKIANEIKALEAIENVKENFSLTNLFKLLITLSSLGLFNIIFLFPYLFSVFMLMLAGFISIVLVFVGILQFSLGLLDIVFEFSFLNGSVAGSFGRAFIAIFVGLVIAVVDIIVIRYFYKFTVRYIKMNISMIREER